MKRQSSLEEEDGGCPDLSLEEEECPDVSLLKSLPAASFVFPSLSLHSETL